MKFPPHKASLHLSHNEHKSCYRTVQESIDEAEFGYAVKDWISQEQMQKAIDTGECWTLQWYPETPIGFHVQSAADLDALLAAVAGATDDSK